MVKPKPITSGKKKVIDRTVPRTPKQEKILVPDLSGNTVRRASSIFGPKPLRKALSVRPESPLGSYKFIIPDPDIPSHSSSTREATPRVRSRSRQASPCRKPPCSPRGSRDRSVPSSPCRKHRSPSGKPMERRHSPCARLASRQSSPTTKITKDSKKPPCGKTSAGRKDSASSKSLSPGRKENIPIHLFPPTPVREKPSSPTRTYRIGSSSDDEFRTNLKPGRQTVSSPAPRRKRTSKDGSVASFVVLQDTEEINNNKVKKFDGKEQRWMPSWYENPRK